MKCIGIHISNISLQNQFLVLSQRDTGKCKIFSITVHMFIFSTHIITKIHRSKSYWLNVLFLPSIDHFLSIRNINFLTLTWNIQYCQNEARLLINITTKNTKNLDVLLFIKESMRTESILQPKQMRL